MGEIKSAWQIAMEKAERLGKLSPEELKQRQQEEGTLLGQALADRYLGGLDLRFLEMELSKYSGDQRELVRKAAASRLVEAVELGDRERLEKVLDGILLLRPEAGGEETAHKLSELLDQHRQAEQKRREQIEGRGQEILHQLRISGSAIEAINPEAREEWKQLLAELAQPFQERLNRLKDELAG